MAPAPAAPFARQLDALVAVNGKPLCTATLANGLDTCTGIIKGSGTLRYSASFVGTGKWAGVTGGTSPGVRAPTSTVATVAVKAASTKVTKCAVVVRGLDMSSGRTIKVSRKSGKRWIAAGKARTGRNGAWAARVKIKARTTIIRASDGRSTTAAFTVRVNKIPRSC